ncbi:MAG TPA: hypothetical protein VN328_13190 [Thermodesulfovibrionales bacterium]|nr:hypothetical protein [Thermodesulfovibrionales bacterium]
MSRFAVILISLIVPVLFLIAREGAAAGPAEGTKSRMAVFIPANLSGKPAPLRELRESLVRGISSLGIPVLDEAALQGFMRRHRVRYTGGIDDSYALALKNEEKVDAVLISSVELYEDGIPPKIAVMSRMVSTGEGPRILWMENVAISGDDSPGILGLGLITDHAVLREKVVQSLVLSLRRHLSGEKAVAEKVKKKYDPRSFYRAPSLASGRSYTVAVVPFFNVSDKKYGTEIMALHFANALIKDGGFNVVEPGVLRQRLLHARFIMNEGITLTDADAVSLTLNADLVLAGKVAEYQDFSGTMGEPKVEFSALVIEKMSKLVVWSSISYNRGNEGVFFFDRGRVSTAGRLAANMTAAVVSRMSENR